MRGQRALGKVTHAGEHQPSEPVSPAAPWGRGPEGQLAEDPGAMAVPLPPKLSRRLLPRPSPPARQLGRDGRCPPHPSPPGRDGPCPPHPSPLGRDGPCRPISMLITSCESHAKPLGHESPPCADHRHGQGPPGVPAIAWCPRGGYSRDTASPVWLPPGPWDLLVLVTRCPFQTWGVPAKGLHAGRVTTVQSPSVQRRVTGQRGRVGCTRRVSTRASDSGSQGLRGGRVGSRLSHRPRAGAGVRVGRPPSPALHDTSRIPG